MQITSENFFDTVLYLVLGVIGIFMILLAIGGSIGTVQYALAGDARVIVALLLAALGVSTTFNVALFFHTEWEAKRHSKRGSS
jgi:cytochrome c biogenesis protein CcdA